jgi:hypothetical protein
MLAIRPRNRPDAQHGIFPRISFGMIVLNGEPFIRYNLQALYPFAHQIIVVEGACPSAKDFATEGGHSQDGTLGVLRRFQTDEDPEGKFVIVTAEDEGHPNGFWSEKDEMSQAYARRASGDYLWQVDVDEFYCTEDMQAVIEMLRQDPEIKAATFRVLTFWGGLRYRTDGIRLRRGEHDFHRLFACAPGYQYISHRPPTVVDEHGRDLRTIRAVTGEEMARRGIYLYHYSFVFPFQVRFKLAYYGPLGPSVLSKREAWLRNYFDLTRPFFIDDTSVLGEPSWLLRFQGQHPDAIQQLWQDIERGDVYIELRSTEDIERLLASPWYAVCRALLPIIWKPINWARSVAGILRRVARKWKRPENVARFVGRVLRRIALSPDLVLSTLRLACLSLPGTSIWASNRWSLHRLAAGNTASGDEARRAQFGEWYPEDIRPKINWYGRHGWRALVPEPTLDVPAGVTRTTEGTGTLLVAARGFFETYTAEEGKQVLSDTLKSLGEGDCLLVYAPHEFAFGGTGRFAWIPGWEELYALAEAVGGMRVFDFNPGFDRNGFFHFIIERHPQEKTRNDDLQKTARIRAAHYFYLNVGTSRTLGHSAQVLSASGLRALRRFVGRAMEHHFSARVPEDVVIRTNDLTMGHYGPWITAARQNGALTILYGPGDRFRKERHDEPFYTDLQSRGTFHEQYLSSHMVIMQAGGLWRVVDPCTYPGLCRWIDLPVSPAVFPRTKKKIAPPGQRVFCFINLYNDYAKGAVPARKICERCPDLSFMAVGCKKPFNLPNVREYPRVDSRSIMYRHLVVQADFVITPAWDDPQPGTVAECGSLGLLPIVSEYAGYVLSFPRRIDLDDLDQCAETLYAAQAASEEEVQGWQMLYAQYIERYHRPESCQALLLFYLQEALAEFLNSAP